MAEFMSSDHLNLKPMPPAEAARQATAAARYVRAVAERDGWDASDVLAMLGVGA